MSKILVELFDTEDEKCPVGDFIASQEAKMQAKILRTIDLLENRFQNV